MIQSKISALIAGCRKAQQSRIANSLDCFKLFTLAFVEEDSAAWGGIFETFQNMVRGWVHRHERFDEAAEEVDFFVNEAFGRFWQHGRPNAQKGRFQTLAAYLDYLRKCTWSAVENYLRKRRQDGLWQGVEINEAVIGATTPTSDLLREQIGDVLWGALSEDELIVARAIWIFKLKPREIQAQHAAKFPTVQDVYQTKKNILRRLKRDPALRKLWEEIQF